MEDYDDLAVLMRMKWWFIDWSYFTYFTFFLGSVTEIIYYIRDENLRDNFYLKDFEGIGMLILLHFASILLMIILKLVTPKPPKCYHKIKDLVRGTITVDPKDLFDAYNHFKNMQGVRVFTIRQDIDSLQRVMVNFVFNETFIGEMEFRFQEYPNVYHSQAFLYEIDRSLCQIELQEALNKQAVWMSNNALLTSKVELVIQEE